MEDYRRTEPEVDIEAEDIFAAANLDMFGVQFPLEYERQPHKIVNAVHLALPQHLMHELCREAGVGNRDGRYGINTYLTLREKLMAVVGEGTVSETANSGSVHSRSVVSSDEESDMLHE